TLRMHPQQTRVRAVAVELLLGQPAAQLESSVERQRGMALRENEAITLEIVGSGDKKHVAVQGRDDLRDAQRRPDVADLGALRLLDYDAPDRSRLDCPHLSPDSLIVPGLSC